MKCFSPADGKVLGESHPVVLSKCNNQASRFRMCENGTIQHVPSGMCVHPTGGCSLPEDNTELVLSKRCNGKKENFLFNRDGLLIHSSKKCARPAHDSDKVPDNTRVVVHQFCTALKFAFAFSGKWHMHRHSMTFFLMRFTNLGRGGMSQRARTFFRYFSVLLSFTISCVFLYVFVLLLISTLILGDILSSSS